MVSEALYEVTDGRLAYLMERLVIEHLGRRMLILEGGGGGDDDDDGSEAVPVELDEPCPNCLSPYHAVTDCEADCGHCGQDWHAVDACMSIPRNRCKCTPFPQRHLAKRCPVVCTGECPKTERDRPGSDYHRNAMTCKARCCMCGLLGHAGRDCHLKQCRCGTSHLTIDHPSDRRRCVVRDCSRFFCTKHCQGDGCKAQLQKLGESVCGSCGADQRTLLAQRLGEDHHRLPPKG